MIHVVVKKEHTQNMEFAFGGTHFNKSQPVELQDSDRDKVLSYGFLEILEDAEEEDNSRVLSIEESILSQDTDRLQERPLSVREKKEKKELEEKLANELLGKNVEQKEESKKEDK